MALEAFLKVVKGFNVVVMAGARATVYAVLAAVLLVYAGILLRAIVSLNLKILLFTLMFIPLLFFLFWLMLVTHAAREVLFEALVRESSNSSLELFDKILTPTAFTLGFILLVWLLVSRPLDSWFIVVEQPFFPGFVIGYFLAPTLIRKRLLARLLERLGEERG